MAAPVLTFAHDQLVEIALHDLNSRKRRASVLQRGLAGEPAWLMLLDLYVAERRHKRVQTVYLVEESGASHATGLRYLALLAKNDLVTRIISESDKRSKYVELTDFGRSTIEDYLRQSLADLRCRKLGWPGTA